jgi:transposase InsO family protein
VKLAAAHPVAVLCPLLGVSRSGYYGWRQRAASRRQSEDAQLTEELQHAFEQSRRTYGRPRLTRALRARGHCQGERRIGRLMRAAGLCARPRRRFVPKTTDSRHDGPIAHNRVAERAAPPTQPDEVWSVDMTYIETTEGWLFLAIVCLHRHDPASRQETKALTFDYIETFYNRTRLHSALGYQSPLDFENAHH